MAQIVIKLAASFNRFPMYNNLFRKKAKKTCKQKKTPAEQIRQAFFEKA